MGKWRKMLNNDAPVVSVIVPVYNRASIVIGTLQAIKTQLYRPIELIIIDDGSNDQTAEVITLWAAAAEDRDFTVRVLKQENMGAPSARNAGLRAVTGKYIQFLDSDDLIDSVKIKKQVEMLEKTKADIAVCDFQYVNENGDSLFIIRNDGCLRRKLVFNEWSLSVFTPLIRAALVVNVVWWNEALKLNQDMDYMFKALAVSREYIYTPGVWCNYVQHADTQISDGCLVRRPSYEHRVYSLLIFLLHSYQCLTYNGVLMLLGGALVLAKNGVLWWPKKIVKRLIKKTSAFRS